MAEALTVSKPTASGHSAALSMIVLHLFTALVEKKVLSPEEAERVVADAYDVLDRSAVRVPGSLESAQAFGLALQKEVLERVG